MTDLAQLEYFLFCCGRRCPLRCPWPQQVFRLEDLLPWRLPSRIPGAWSLPSGQDDFVPRQLGLQLPSFGQPCGVVPCSRSPFGGNTSGLRLCSRAGTSSMPSPCGSTSVRSLSPVDGVSISCLPFCGSTSGGGSCTCLPSPGNISTSRLATLCAQGTNASGLAAVAFSASPAGSTPTVPSARACASPTISSAPPRLCVSTPEGSTFLAPMSATVHSLVHLPPLPLVIDYYNIASCIFTAVIWYKNNHDPYRKPKTKTIDGTVRP